MAPWPTGNVYLFEDDPGLTHSDGIFVGLPRVNAGRPAIKQVKTQELRMLRKQQIIVLGLGQFGATIATELESLGHQVLGIDTDEARVDLMAETITQSIIGDVTDERTLEELDAGSYDVAVMAIGGNLQAAFLATMQLHELGVEKVWARAVTPQHHRILAKLGATRVIGLEREMGMAIAQELSYPMVNNFIDMDDEQYIVEIVIEDDLEGSSLGDMLKDSAVQALLLKRDENVRRDLSDDLEVRQGDRLILAGELSQLQSLAENL